MKSIIIIELYLVLIYLVYRLYYSFLEDRRLMVRQRIRQRERAINKRKGLRPEMRDPILKRR